MTQLPLFVFGTLRRGESNHHLLEDKYDRVLAARLPDFARVEPLMIARSEGAEVLGELFFLTPATYAETLHACDGLEELFPNQLFGPEYRRVAVRVVTEMGPFVAWAYVRPDTKVDADLQPLVAIEAQRLQRM